MARADDGELLARSDYAMWRSLKPPYTRSHPFPGRRVLVRTGDLGSTDGDGRWTHEGRTDHILNVAGTKVDLRQVSKIIHALAAPLLVNVSSRPARAGGDLVPVIEIVPDGPAPLGTAALRRALHAEFGSLAALFDVRYVDRPTVKESGK